MLKKLSILMVTLCCLTGCGAEEVDLESVSEYYEQINVLTLEATISTNSGALISYDILFTRTEDGDSVTILSPDSLAGITAKIYPDKTEIVYEDMAVETLLPGISGYVPADAVTGMLKDIGKSVPDEYGLTEVNGREAILLTFADEYDGMTAEKTLWLSRDDLSLIKGEFFLDGVMIMELNVKSFVI